MTGTLEQAIRKWYPSLSKGQQKVADYLMKHQEKSAFLTASELGKEAGTSETTVIRVSYVLGFRGYSAMQKMIREDLLDQGEADGEEEMDVFQRVMKEEQEIYERLPSQLDMEDAKKAVEGPAFGGPGVYRKSGKFLRSRVLAVLFPAPLERGSFAVATSGCTRRRLE
ncbi:hypothetical protein U0355_01590 [Salimicrobium sp. PL1-032A]|uniref:MurR/RpiR family transcriptional regulator n=1 Tax=Salimicrobium sp. PL1-032A TaxID=3095364 RepID=UPI003260CED5